MKFVCSKESLMKSLGIAENVITTKNNISILSNVLLETKEDRIKISACDTAIHFFGDIGGDIIEGGAVSIYCNRLYSIIKKLPADEIEIYSDENNLVTVKPKDNNKIVYKLKGVDPEKFPVMETIDDVNFFSIKQEIFTEMTAKTQFAVSMTESRRFVSGILFEKHDDSLRMVATDGKRLAFIKKDISLPSIDNINVIAPPKVLLEATKLCTGNGDILLSLTDKNIYINIDNYYFISNLLEGAFPPYEKVIPEDQDRFFKVNKKEFHAAIDRISLMGDKESHKIILSIIDNQLKIHTENITLGTGEEIIPVEYEGEDIKIAFNYVYLMELLSVFKNDNVLIEFKDPKSTITIREDEDQDYICIMMPMQV